MSAVGMIVLLAVLPAATEGDELGDAPVEAPARSVRGSAVATAAYQFAFFVDPNINGAVQSTTAHRQLAGISYDADVDFGWDLKLQLSTDVAELLVGLAGGLRAGALAVRTEATRSRGALVAQRVTIADPRDADLESLYATVRVGYDLRSHERADYRRTLVVGGGLIYQTAPMAVRIAGIPGGFGNTPDYVLDRSWNAIIAGLWFEMKALPSLVSGGDVWMPLFADLWRGDSAVLGLNLDFGGVMGIGGMWPGEDHERLVELVLGTSHSATGGGFLPLAMTVESTLGLAASFDVAGLPVGISAGMHLTGLVALSIFANEAPDPDGGETAESPSIGIMRLIWGPQVELAVRL
ncbi:hypothetical protein L6R52_36070 [Myxococcota bacterium]|nr:hypothetical protein [Myxococcota bacterium]